MKIDEENMAPLRNFMAAVTAVVVALVSIRREMRAKLMPKKSHKVSRPGWAPSRNIGKVATEKSL